MMSAVFPVDFFRGTLEHCDDGSGITACTLEQVMHILLDCTRKKYPTCKDFFSDELTTEELDQSMGCLSVATRHATARRVKNGLSLHFTCECEELAINSASIGAGERQGAVSDADGSGQGVASDANKMATEHCPFSLHFRRRKGGKLWHFCAKESCLRMTCPLCVTSSISRKRPFLRFAESTSVDRETIKRSKFCDLRRH